MPRILRSSSARPGGGQSSRCGTLPFSRPFSYAVKRSLEAAAAQSTSGRVVTRRAVVPSLNAAEGKRQAEAGIQTITLKGAELEKWNSTAQEAGWAYVKEIAPKSADELRKLLAP